jgi:hypothetical protein
MPIAAKTISANIVLSRCPGPNYAQGSALAASSRFLSGPYRALRGSCRRNCHGKYVEATGLSFCSGGGSTLTDA